MARARGRRCVKLRVAEEMRRQERFVSHREVQKRDFALSDLRKEVGWRDAALQAQREEQAREKEQCDQIPPTTSEERD